MGPRQSKPSAAASPPSSAEPRMLLTTSAGVIVRFPDSLTGASTFHHHPHFHEPATIADALRPTNASEDDAISSSKQVLVAKSGAKNRALQDKLVFVKTPPRAKQRPTGCID